MNRSSSLYGQPLVPVQYDAVTDCEYDSAGRMTSCKFRSGGVTGAVLSTLTMTYDALGQMLTAVRS